MTTSRLEWAPMAVWAGFAGAMLALAVPALAPAGWRLGLWHFRTSFYWLMPASAFLAAGAALLSVAGLTLGVSTLSGFDAARAVTAIIVGAVLVYVPWREQLSHCGHWSRTSDSCTGDFNDEEPERATSCGIPH